MKRIHLLKKLLKHKEKERKNEIKGFEKKEARGKKERIMERENK